MSVANFFDKAALAAAQVLQGVSHDSLIAFLDEHAIGLAFDDAAVSCTEGARSLELALNLFARFYSRITFIPRGEQAQSKIVELINIAKAINPEITIEENGSAATAILAIGNSVVTMTVPTIYVGSDGWTVRVSCNAPVGSGKTLNPFGAGAAACFGAANIFRLLFSSYLSEGKFDEDFSLSLLDYKQGEFATFNPNFQQIDLGESYLVGLGAIGNAAVWALARTPELSGNLNLIDGETIELSNLQRYVLTTQSHIDEPKVMLAARQFSQPNLLVKPHRSHWGDYLRASRQWKMSRVAVAVDSDEDRRAIQAALPEWIVNSWTQTGDLGISRHDFLGENACLMCLYFPNEAGKNLDQIVAQAINLPEAQMKIRALLYNNSPIGEEFLQRAAAAMRVPAESLSEFEQSPLRNFYTKAVCGGAVLRLGGAVAGTSRDRATAVPLAFQSALAGIMLAAELVIHAGNLKPSTDFVTTKLDLLRPLKSYLCQPAGKHPSRRCICHDEDYINIYRNKY